MQKQITVTDVREPPAGRSQYTVIDTSGDESWRIGSDLTGVIKPGGSYKVEFRSSTFKGMEYKFINKVLESSAPEKAVEYSSLKATGTKPSQAIEMLAMGVVGRTMQGTGSIMTEDQYYSAFRNLIKAWGRAFSEE